MSNTLSNYGSPTVSAVRGALAHTHGVVSLLDLPADDLLNELGALRIGLGNLDPELALPLSDELLLLGRLDLLVLGDELSENEKTQMRQLLDDGLATLRDLEGALLKLRPLLGVLGFSLNRKSPTVSTVLDGLSHTEDLDSLLDLPADDLLDELGALRIGLGNLDPELALPISDQRLLLGRLDLLILGDDLGAKEKTRLKPLLDGGLLTLRHLEAALLDLRPLLEALGLTASIKAISFSLRGPGTASARVSYQGP